MLNSSSLCINQLAPIGTINEGQAENIIAIPSSIHWAHDHPWGWPRCRGNHPRGEVSHGHRSRGDYRRCRHRYNGRRKEESRPTSQNSRRHGRGKREDAKGQEYLFHNLKSTIIGLWSEGCQKLLSFAGSRTGSLQSPVGIWAAVILEKSFGVQ